MSQKKFISQDFSGGLDRDSHVSATPDNTYTYALNLVNRDLEQSTFVSNENSNRLCGETVGTVVGAGYIDELNKTIYFNSDGEIYLLDNETCEAEFVASDTEFKCDWGFQDCEWVTPHFKTANNCNEVFVYWSSGCEYYKINLTEMLDSTRKQALLDELLETDEEDCTRKTCTYFKVFKCACAPKLSPIVYPSGGSLKAGNYQFMIRLINEDGAPSNWFGPSDMVYVGSDKNIAGEVSNSYIELGLSCLDCKFARVEIAVIETIGGITTAKVITRSGYNTDTHSYAYYGNEGDPIDITELLVKGKTYIQGQDMMLKDNRAWYYNIKPRVNLDYQRRANSIVVEGLEYEFSLEDAKKYNIKSYMRGESYGYGIVWNYKDGTHSRVFVLSPNGGDDSGDGQGVVSQLNLPEVEEGTGEVQGLSISTIPNLPSSDTETPTGEEQTQSSGTISMSQIPEYRRSRNSADRTVANPHADEYGDQLKGFVDNINADLSSVCEAIDSGCGPEALAEDAFNEDGSVNCDCGDVVDAYCRAAERALHASQCNADQGTIDEMGNNWLDVLSSFGIADKDKKDLELDFSPANIKEAASRIIKAVQERERAEIIPPNYSVNKSGIYATSSSRGSDIKPLVGSITGQTTSTSILADGLHTCKGEAITSLDDNIIDTFQLEAKTESTIYYPSTKNCNGEFIYGESLAGNPVQHFKFPTAAEKPHFISKSIGVPSNATPDADEYADGYIRPFGIKVSNIVFPSDDELSIPLCPHNPYTIVQIERTDSNKTVMSKGLATQTFTSTNQTKPYVYTKLGVNSFERASRYIDIDGSRMDAAASEHDSFNFWSLDTMVKRPSLNIDSFRAELTLSGIGFRHGLYAQGRKPDNSLYGNRIDQRGTRQAINLSNSTTGSSADNPVSFKIYSPANSVTAPPAGGDLPLMNKYGQETLWIGGELPAINDKSFVGDVLNHTAPISDASGHYVGLIRNLPNQYGDLVNLNYIPVLQAGNGRKEEIGGLCGDVYIGPYSFVRTHYVSNKVGNKFPISNMVEGKSDRSICDDPEDAIHSANGLWVPTTLPKDSDAADAKNWAGLHTPGDERSLNWELANASGTTQSDYYYPKTLTTLITYWGEFEVNPYLRQKGDTLSEQFYPEINPLYYLDSNAPDSHPWEDSYLNQFYCEVTQPSLWDKVRKGLIRTILNVIFPMIGIDNLLDITSGEALIANIVEIPMLIAMWFMMTQLLFTNDALDRLLGIPTCKTDDEGGEDDGCVRKFFRNPAKYNWDYSRSNNIYQYFGMPDPYYTCDCDDCLRNETTNEVYYSDKQVLTSFLDAYGTVRPNNMVSIPANAGKLRKLFSIGNDFYAHTTDAIWQLRYGRVAVPTSTGEIILGTGNLLSEPQAILEDTPEGFAGIRDPNSSINTQYGYFFIDADARKLYQFAGQGGLKEISRNGMFNFFKEFLDFCEASECSDEKVPGTNYYSLGVDPRLNRLLVTKSDTANPWTLSYDLERERWISFHSYTPQAYVWDRDHMYTLDGKGFWKHDVKCEFQKFFDQGYPHVIEFVNNDSDIQAFSYGSSIIDTDARICSGNEYLYGRDITFNKIGMWNSYQTTGMVDLRVRSDSNNEEEDALGKIRENTTNIEIVRENLQWRLNELQDYTADHNSPLLTREDCNPFSDPINTDYCLDLDQQNYKNRIVFDNYLTTRIVFSNFNDVKLYTRGYLTYIDKQVN